MSAWNAYHLVESNNSIELIMSESPKKAGPITVKAYPGRAYQVYPSFDHITFGVDWHSSDEEIAHAFVLIVDRLTQQHPAVS